MIDMPNIKPPSDTDDLVSERAQEALKRGVALLPYGSQIHEILEVVFPNALKKRREMWELAVTDVINKFDRLKLFEDEEFISNLVRTSEQARRNHQAEKLECIKNGLESSIEQFSFEKSSFFLKWLDELTETEIAILTLAAKGYRENNPSETRGGVFESDILTGPLKGNEAFFDIINEEFQTGKQIWRSKNHEDNVVFRLNEQGIEFCKFLGLL